MLWCSKDFFESKLETLGGIVDFGDIKIESYLVIGLDLGSIARMQAGVYGRATSPGKNGYEFLDSLNVRIATSVFEYSRKYA